MKDKRGAQRDADAGLTSRQPPAVARASTLRVIERYGPQLMRTARRYAATVEDAKDAYQRGIEIMLTKAPDIPEAELLPWLKTVVSWELGLSATRRGARTVVGSRNAPSAGLL